MSYTADPCLDAARWECAQEAKASAAEFAEAHAFERIKAGFLYALQFGPAAGLDLPPNLPGRDVSDAISELQDNCHPNLIDRAICLLALLKDPAAQAMAQELATAYALITITEWRRR